MSRTTASAPPTRLERLRSAMAERELDLVVAAGAEAVNHLCGYWRYFGSPPALAVERDGTTTLLVQLDEEAAASAGAHAATVATYGARGFGLRPDPTPDLAAALAALPPVRDAGRIGLAAGDPSLSQQVAALVGGAVSDVGAVLQRLRLVKDRDELGRILAAYELAWTAQAAAAEALRPGVSEIELFTAAQGAAQVAAGEPIAFAGDLLSGTRSADVCAPVSVAGPRRIGAGDAVVADLVVGRRGYWGDTAETLVTGENGEVAEVRLALEGIRERAARLLAPGRTGAEVFAAMSGEILETFPGGEFPHHGGHAVGLTSFEDPHVIPGDETPLAESMVIALEPGVYFPGRFGVRVERLYVVGAAGGVELRDAVAGEG